MIDVRSLNKLQLNHKAGIEAGGHYFVYDEMGERLFFVNKPKPDTILDLGLYGQESKTNRIYSLRTKKASKFPLYEFFFYDKNDRLIAIYEKNTISGLMKAAWNVYTDEEKKYLFAKAEEDSVGSGIFKAVVRKDVGYLSDFTITKSSKVCGKFIRNRPKGTLYLLDLSLDPGRKLDRHVALGLAIVLDVGETL